MQEAELDVALGSLSIYKFVFVLLCVLSDCEDLSLRCDWLFIGSRLFYCVDLRLLVALGRIYFLRCVERLVMVKLCYKYQILFLD